MYFTTSNFRSGPYFLTSEAGVTLSKEGPVPHKWLPRDSVDPESGAVVKREPHSVVGILELNTRTTQGFNARKVPLYLFYPLDASYPPIIVASKDDTKSNVFAVVDIERWEEKWPRGGLQTILGPVDDPESESKALLLRATVRAKNTPLPPPPDLSTYRLGDWDTVVHIDPEGCQDVDDILCLKRAEGGWDLGIGIADVAAWVPEGHALDDIARLRGQTVYVEGEARIPMLPTTLSTDLASLRADGRARPVVLYRLSIREGKVVSRSWHSEQVVVGVSHTYDSVLADSSLREIIPELLGIATETPVGTDSHHWIEMAMILYNTAGAAALRTAGKGLLRAHAGITRPEWAALAATIGCPEVATFGYSKGRYLSATEADCSHAGLGLDVYCHASSPLRRYSDLVNQRWLKALLLGSPEPSTTVATGTAAERLLPLQLNERARIIKQMERDLWFASHLHADRITEVDGFLIEAKEDRRGEKAWNVYIPEWKRIVRGIEQTGTACTIGDRVQVRAYVNLSATQWDKRTVCAIHRGS